MEKTAAISELNDEEIDAVAGGDINLNVGNSGNVLSGNGGTGGAGAAAANSGSTGGGNTGGGSGSIITVSRGGAANGGFNIRFRS